MTNRQRQEAINNTNDLVNSMNELYKRAYARFKQEMDAVNKKMKLTDEEKVLFSEYYALWYKRDQIMVEHNLKGKTAVQIATTSGTTKALQETSKLIKREKEIENIKTIRLEKFVKEVLALRNSRK